MPIQHAVLALLMDGPGHGYELKGAFETSVGPHWGPLNIGHLYQVLDRLSRDGLAVSHRVAQQVKPDRVVYEITGNGRAELRRWLATPVPRTSGYRDDFFLKVMAAAHSRDPDVVRTVLATQRGFLQQELDHLDELARSADTVVGLLLSAASRHVSADLAFLDDAETRLLGDGGAALAAIEAPRTPAPRTPAPGGSRPRQSPSTCGV
jgi:DNA-binding PadR family transcriptional regulator